jgi:hypothetical protein
MKNKLDTMVVLFPVMSVLVIALFAGGLGAIFSVIHETTHSEVGVIILGVALVVGVPAAAALVQKRMEQE